ALAWDATSSVVWPFWRSPVSSRPRMKGVVPSAWRSTANRFVGTSSTTHSTGRWPGSGAGPGGRRGRSCPAAAATGGGRGQHAQVQGRELFEMADSVEHGGLVGGGLVEEGHPRGRRGQAWAGVR